MPTTDEVSGFYSRSDSALPELPPASYGDPAKCTDTHKSKVRSFIDAGISYTHPYFWRRAALWRKADLFFEAIQWLRKSFNTDPTQTIHWSRMEFGEKGGIPTPVYDEFSAHLENEHARLSKPEYEGYVRPQGENPSIEVRNGAKAAKYILKQALDDMRWNEIEDRGLLHMPLYGQWFLKSYWDTSWEKTTRIPVTTAMSCPNCDFKVADPNLSASTVKGMVENNPEQADRVDLDSTGPQNKYGLSMCLTCDPKPKVKPMMSDDGQPVLGQMTDGSIGPLTFEDENDMEPVPDLQPYKPNAQETQTGKDFFGKPLGKDVPLGEWKLRTVDPRDIFVENLGIGVQAAEIRSWYECHVETLDWVRNRYPSGGLVERENAMAIMQWHAVAGERAIFYARGSAGGIALFRQHVRVKEYHEHPKMVLSLDPATNQPFLDPSTGKKTGQMEKSKGRSVVWAGDVLLFDGDFMIDSQTNPGTQVPRCHLDVAQWKLKTGGMELYGTSLSEGEFDPQENINEMKSQIQDTRQVLGSPRWLVTRGMNLEYKQGDSAGEQWLFDPDPMHPDAKPEPVGSELFNEQVYTELNDDRGFMGRHSHLNEVESGTPPPGVTAALAMQVLAEQTNEHRRPRIRRIREMLERCFTHGLILMHELVREPRSYWTDDMSADGEEHEKSWEGIDLAGQTQVRIDAEPDHDSSLVRQQTMRDVIGLVGWQALVTNRRMNRIVAQELGWPEELFDEENKQEQGAAREYLLLRTQQRDPFVDDDLDDHDAHDEQHGLDCMSEYWRDQEDTSEWDKVLMYLEGWQDKFNDKPGAPLMGPPDPKTGQPSMMPGPTIPGLRSMISQPQPGPVDPRTGQPSTQPPVVPPLLELQILAAWNMILQQYNFQSSSPEAGLALQPVMRFRAHRAAHRMKAEEAKARAAAGQVEMAAPGGEATASGTMPTTGQSPVTM